MVERPSRVDGVRRTNLGKILRCVHLNGPQSRAALTTETGLNRSTVSDLVSELALSGLVTERDPDPTRRVGRPSPIVAASDDVVAIAINPEIDALEVGAVTLGGRVRERVRETFTQPPSAADTVAAVARIVTGWRTTPLAECRMIGLGVALPGLVRADTGLVRLAPHLGWRDENFGHAISLATELSVVVGNDATLGAQAEHLFGAARTHHNVVYLNGGASGIGGGLILQGVVIEGADGYAGEWGHIHPGIDRESDRRTPSGTLEDEVNQTRLLQAAGLGPVDHSALAATLAASEDPRALAEIDRQRRILAVVLANAINVLNPSMIVLGGFLAILHERDPEGLLADVQARALTSSAENITISAAALGRDRLLIGAAEAAFAALLADPVGV
ncbi:ROK family transcriptional regulator [Klugiella xanthotipulae]|uniref:Putative NBD/HSP70 family sugar kinase n=1 Tax=Klugiella xanthotipulae TaxID=244735 RepID=A0A543I3S6_9MICO|nr:ROK family transcriptional regulator [Klugiella xanthotipulae]TQM65253.1 putative NBD/HSP70 family sugar kinase [Klugiella xanthotipulae]